MTEHDSPQIVFTLTARCRDCYRCLRSCPVKAIRMDKGQAYVDKDRCIACGTCIRECPQQAKTFRYDIDVAQKLIDSGAFVAASLAPSFAALFNVWQRKRLPSALRALGFKYIGQTSQGAYQVSVHARKVIEKSASKPYVATACPALVNYVEKYKPDLVGNLLPIVSPMAAHGRMLKEKFGPDIKVIFMGPCVAKKSEITRPDIAGAVDCVLTFKELMMWLEQKGIDLLNCEESSTDEKPVYAAQLYPLPGGMIKTAGLIDDGLDLKFVHVGGFNNVRALLNDVPGESGYTLVEPLFCSQGCIDGPGINTRKNLFQRRKDIIEYDKESVFQQSLPDVVEKDGFFTTSFQRGKGVVVEVSEDAIQQVLESTGKADPQQQLNCGACGFNSCREKAIAVVLGMAEPQMCIPYMRRLAEQRTDQIVNTTPNGVLILDEDLNILSINPAFRRFFSCTDAVLGRHISYLMDPAPFEKLISGVAESIDMTVEHRNYNLLTRELLYMLKESRQIVGIFMNITSQEENEKKLKEIRSQTVLQANELLEHQIKMAQTIALYLGESTARGEELLKKLMTLSENNEPEDR